MFNNIGWGEIVFIAVIALFIFGPERLPHIAKDAADGLKKARRAMTGVREQVNDSLGEDFAHLRDLDLRQYHPRTFIRNQLLADDDDDPPVRSGSTASATYTSGRSRDRATPPPFDSDAT
jgi:sec-independent protein translocase protein TatB